MTVYGWDMSHYDSVAGNTAERVISEGFTFVTHKAGGDANDAEIGAFWAEFKGHRDKLLIGAYWVLYPGNPIGRADAFCDRLDSQCPGWGDAPFILQVDCEIWGGNRGTLPGKGDIKQFCDRLRQRAPKLMPIVYGPEWCYGDKLSGLGYPLWASRYVDGTGAASALYPGDGSSKWGAYSGQTPEILQFTSSATIAGQTTCDANAYRGTLAELTELVAPGWEIEDMATAEEIATAVIQAMQSKDGILAGPSMAASVKDGTNTTWTDAGFQRDQSNGWRQVLAAVQALVPAASVDVNALAAAIVAQLPTTPGAAPTASEVASAVVDLLDTKLSS